MMVIGISTLLACSGIQPEETETKTDAMQITPQRIKDIVGIEWHLKKEMLVLISTDTSTVLEFQEN